MVIESCITNPKISLILVHEQDSLKGGCEFGDFFKVTPQKLIDEPYSLYRDIAIPLFSLKEYRDVSLKLILNKIVGSDPTLRESNVGYIRESIQRTLSQIARGGSRRSRS
mmetsp:Transcript_25854/g.32570  ORF Transcript_25854/g.32570 Transcript_25854/m.32570 type:complete len:110 (+) Transcript_25854:3-332(+)